MAEPSIEIRLEGISATFHHERRGDITAVHEISTSTVRPGEFLTLLGSSGCGKTTTLRMIAGFQKPSSGAILFGDEDVTGLAANQRDIGFVFQNYALFPHLSVFENVAYGLRVKRRDAARDRKQRRAGSCGRSASTALGERMINELSGGQQQRVALARAIAIRPRVLLFDEPLSNLDAQLRVQMRERDRPAAARARRSRPSTSRTTRRRRWRSRTGSPSWTAGLIAQIGTAEELYQRPTSRFVAGFLGSANLLARNGCRGGGREDDHRHPGPSMGTGLEQPGCARRRSLMPWSVRKR